jgi:putative N6-adenine-specific DNA methylase
MHEPALWRAHRAKGRGPAPVRARRLRRRRHVGGVLRRLASALEAPLRRLDRLVPQPGDEAAVADAPEGSRRVPMWNGPIECRLFRFDLVAGSNRASAPDA